MKKRNLYAAAVMVVTASCAISMAQEKLVFQKNSLYHNITVHREGSVYFLRFNRRADIIQSSVDHKKPRKHMLEYSKLSFCGLLYHPEPERVLILGLGGGVIPRDLRHYFPNMKIDAVEIDPEVINIAKQYFLFKTDANLNAYTLDGRMFIRQLIEKKSTEKYDIVILDAFLSEYIPFHLMTREFVRQVHQVLAEDGVVVANVFRTNRLFHSELKTFMSVFGESQVYYGKDCTNAMIVSCGPKAPKKTLTLREAMLNAIALQKKHKFAFLMTDVAKRLRVKVQPDEKAEILTDDKAPVNKLRKEK